MTCSVLPIKRKRGDTRRIVFKIKDGDGAIPDISGWTAFLLTVDPSKDPIDATANLFQATGAIISDGTGGTEARVGFTPPGTTEAGDYFYDAQALDANSEKVTFAEGSYKLTQDITKD